MWWETAEGNYVHGETGVVVLAEETGIPDWRLRVSTTGAVSGPRLKGIYATQADAQEAARKLCQGVDPTTITT